MTVAAKFKFIDQFEMMKRNLTQSHRRVTSSMEIFRCNDSRKNIVFGYEEFPFQGTESTHKEIISWMGGLSVRLGRHTMVRNND